MSLKSTWILLGLLLLSSAALIKPGLAEEPPIEQEMPVADRSSPERIKASIRGFFEVLSALPGEQLDNQTKRELAGEADRYLQGYRYAARNERLVLQLYFDREAVQQRVQQELSVNNSGNTSVVAGQPVLLWLAVTQGDLEVLLTEGANGLLPNTLTEVSIAQGQPIVLPADETLARGEVQVAQLRRGEVEPVLRASANYGMNRIMMGSLTLVEGDQWSATWQIPGAGRQWRSNPGTLAEVLDQGLQGYRQLTRTETTSTGRGLGIADDQVAVSVGGLTGMDDFIWVNQKMGAVLGVDKVRAVVIGGESALFAVDAAGDVASIERKLQSLTRLSSVPQSFSDSGTTQSADISYVLY